jgi:predicted DNA-binding protein (UPF0251 family)
MVYLLRTMSRKSYYTITEAAKRLGLSRSTVYEAIKTGRLKASVKKVVQEIWAIDPKSVESYIISASHQERGRKNP